jgi:adenylate cyclase
MEVVGMGFVTEKTSTEERLTRNLFLAAAMFPGIVGLLVGLLFNTFYIRPVRTLRRAVKRMAAGDYDMHSPVLTDDEIGVLCESFNQTTQGLKEKEYLSRFISDMTRDLVKTDGADTLHATRATATVMFSDIRGFTTFSETLPPEEVVAMLNAYLTRMEEVIEAHDGTIDKFIGDAIMAIFMPALGRPEPARRAVLAGLAMQKALSEFNAERERNGLFTIRCGVGIATGEILMGILGGEGGSRNFTVIGPTVNRSAQMEKASKYAQESFVVVCEESKKRLGPEYIFQPISPDKAPMPAFEVIPRAG